VSKAAVAPAPSSPTPEQGPSDVVVHEVRPGEWTIGVAGAEPVCLVYAEVRGFEVVWSGDGHSVQQFRTFARVVDAARSRAAAGR